MPFVLHRDNDPKNNRADNLLWANRSDIYEAHYGLGSDYPGGYDSAKPIKVVETGEVYPSIKACSIGIDGFTSGIRNVLCGKCETYKGFHFELLDSE